MRKQTIVKLSEPFEFHDRTISEIIVKEPTAGHLQVLGEPLTYVKTRDGTGYQVEQNLIIGQYLDRCLFVEQDKPLDAPAVAFGFMSLADGKRVRSALLDFFISADLMIAAERSKSAGLTELVEKLRF